MHKHKVLLILLLATFVFYLSILLNPKLILERGNDLQEFFWPIFYFVQQQILEHNIFPLWNNLFLSGTPLLPDPQSPLFYPPNVIFLILQIDDAFIASFILHSFFGSVGVYWAARRGLGFSTAGGILSALLYIVLPRTAGFLEAGHFGLATSSTWIPFLLLASLRLIRTPHFGWAILFATSLAGLFFTHPTTFVVAAALASAAIFLAGGYVLIKKHSVQTLIVLATGLFLTFGLIAVTLLPQLEWVPQTTRFLLLGDRDVYPKWDGKIEFVKAIYPHVLGGRHTIDSLDTEKWLALGVFVTALSLIGFLQLNTKFKILIITLVFGMVLVTLNNISPLYSLLLTSDWYILGRVSTRVWFVITITMVFLAGFGVDRLLKKGLKAIAIILSFLAIGELIILSWLRIERPIPLQHDRAPAAVYEFLKSDPGEFRVFCVNRCLSQQEAARYNIETIEGYSTLQQKNYYDHFIQLSQVFWDKYTLALPPFEIYSFREIQPYTPETSGYNAKYVIAPYTLKDKNLVLRKEIGKYLIYEDTTVKSRAYFSNGEQAPVVKYSPNYIRVDTSLMRTKQLWIAEVYSPGWIAKLNGEKPVEIKQTANKLRFVELEEDTQFVEMYYSPKSYQTGRIISLSSLFIILVYFVRNKLVYLIALVIRNQGPQYPRK